MKRILILILLAYASMAHAQVYGNYPSYLACGTVPFSYYAILNPSDKTDAGTVLSNGNLTVTTSGGYRAVRSTIGVSSSSAYPLIYIECTVTSGIAPNIGFSNLSWQLRPSSSSVTMGADVAGNSWGFLIAGGSNLKAWKNTYTAYGASFGAGDVIMLALDMTNGFAYFGKNGTWLNSGVPTSGASGTGAAFGTLSGTLYPTFGCYGGNAFGYTINFGATSFTYTPPAGYAGLHH